MPNRVTNALRRVVVSLGTPAIVRHDSSPLPRAATLNSRDIARSEPTPPRTESHAIAEGNLHSIDSVSMQTTNKCIPLNADSYTTGNSGQGNSRAARHTLFGLKCSSFTCDSPNCIVVYCSRSSRSSLATSNLSLSAVSATVFPHLVTFPLSYRSAISCYWKFVPSYFRGSLRPRTISIAHKRRHHHNYLWTDPIERRSSYSNLNQVAKTICLGSRLTSA